MNTGTGPLAHQSRPPARFCACGVCPAGASVSPASRFRQIFTRRIRTSVYLGSSQALAARTAETRWGS
jgi:hypothetical protein